MKAFNPEKELRKIQKGNKNKIITFVILLLIVSVISYSFALYQVRYSKRIIYTKVAPFSTHDLDLAVYVNGKPDELPAKNIGYKYSGLICDNGNPIAEWDEEKWELKFSSTVPIPNKCNLYFIPDEDYDGEEFEYSGQVQEYTVPKDGLYKLEVWGAQGGQNGWWVTSGELGSYTYGAIHLEKGTKLYVVVGGAGVGAGIVSNPSASSGGYNGGGSSGRTNDSGSFPGGGGGGATHIATITGLLPTLESNKEEIIIVAGGGGGANGKCQTTNTNVDGNSIFGQGSAGSSAFNSGGGGGGGYYGGIGGTGNNDKDSCSSHTPKGARGTSYVSPSIIDGTSGMEYNNRTGNGYAKITYLGQQN